MIFGTSKQLNEIVETQISEESYRQLEIWKCIYAGYYDVFHKLSYMTVNGTKKRRRHTLNMAKVSTEELSKLIFTEKVKVNISNETLNENIEDLLNKNRFYKVFQGKLEQMLALGGLVLKANPKEQDDLTYKIGIEYVSPDCFIPTAWENGEINEGVFLNTSRKDNKVYCLFEFHNWKITTNDAGIKVRLYTIKNELYESDKNSQQSAKKVPLETLYPDLQETTSIEGLTKTLFQYIKPNIANNLDLQSPLGISIFANALDTLYAIDVAFDSFITEFKLGKRRIIVPSSAVRTIVDPSTGELHRYFDADDEIYQAMNIGDPDKQKIEDNTVPLRVTEHIAAINALLNLYSMQIGLSSGSFTFDGIQVKTATEVISENSKTYKTIVSNENVIEEGLINFIHTLTEVSALYDVYDLPSEDYEVKLYWDDSIVGDKYTDSDFYIKLNMNGLVSKKYALMQVLDFTEEEADSMIKEASEERASEMPDINSLTGGNNPLGVVE